MWFFERWFEVCGLKFMVFHERVVEGETYDEFATRDTIPYTMLACCIM
jgi:hypothetical protein